MAFDRIATPRKELAASTASERVRPSTPALDAAYGTAPVPPLCASREEMFIIHFEGISVVKPRFLERLRIAARSKAREVRIAPSRFVRRVWVMTCGSVLASIFVVDIPAELIRISTSFYTNISCLRFL